MKEFTAKDASEMALARQNDNRKKLHDKIMHGIKQAAASGHLGAEIYTDISPKQDYFLSVVRELEDLGFSVKATSNNFRNETTTTIQVYWSNV